MKVLFDLNVVSHLYSLGKLDKLVPHRSNIISHASFTFLEELAGLYRTDERAYFRILDWYRSHTWGRLIRPWTVLVREETEARKKAVAYEDLLVVPHEVVLRVFNAMSGGNEFVDELHQHVQSEKNEAKVRLNEMSDWMQRQFAGDHRTEIKRSWRDYRQRIPHLIQSCGEACFDDAHRDYNQLPHLRAHFSFWYVQHFRAIAGKRKLKGNDAYDLGYYVESTTLGNFVTNDKNLIDTIEMIPGNMTNVYNGDEWIRWLGGNKEGPS